MLLSIISAIMAFMLVMTFVRFPVGAVKNYNSVLGAIELDHGMEKSAVYTLTLNAESDIPDDAQMDEVLETLDYRFCAVGYENTSLKKVKGASSNVYGIRIEINPDLNKYYEPDTDVLTSAVDAAIKFGSLQFFSGSTSSEVTNELFAEIGNPIKSVKNIGYNEYTSSYGVRVEFTNEAYDVITDLMAEGDFYFKVMLGEETLLNASEPLTAGYFQEQSISFNATTSELADQMALQIRSGGLDYKFDRSDVAFVSNYLGDNVTSVALIALGALLVLAIVALVLVNKGFGIISAMSLLAYALIYLAMFIAVPGVRLSIGGVIAMALATILAIDGMVATGKRISEEFLSGKTAKSAVRTGFKRSLIPTLGAGIVSVVIALLMFLLVSGEVKSFAIVFGIGSAVASIASILFTRMFSAIILPLVKDKEAFLKSSKEVM